MLNINDSLKPQTIEGKRYRSPEFYIGMIFGALVTVAFIIALIAMPPMDERDTKTVLTMVSIAYLVCLIMPVFWCVADRHIVCILGSDRFYFFRSQVSKFTAIGRKSKKINYCSGTIFYSDIKEITFIKKKWFGNRYQCSLPSRIVLHGNDFEIIIPAFKCMINKLNKRQDVIPSVVEVSKETQYPTGMWGDILRTFDNGTFETLWDTNGDIDIYHCIFEENAIDIAIRIKNVEVCFNIDDSTIYMFYPDSDESKTTLLTEFRNIESLLQYMKACIYTTFR